MYTVFTAAATSAVVLIVFERFYRNKKTVIRFKNYFNIKNIQCQYVCIQIFLKINICFELFAINRNAR